MMKTIVTKGIGLLQKIMRRPDLIFAFIVGAFVAWLIS